MHREDHALHRECQTGTVRIERDAQIMPQVVIAHEQARHTRHGRNRLRLDHAARRFDHGDDGQAADVMQVRHLPGGLDLGEDDEIRLQAMKRREIWPMMRAVARIQTDGDEATAEPFGESGRQGRAGFVLPIFRHGVFEIEDHHVARESPRLLHRPGVGRRQEQQRARVMRHRPPCRPRCEARVEQIACRRPAPRPAPRNRSSDPCGTLLSEPSSAAVSSARVALIGMRLPVP
jgi:hypothetical protein